MTLWFRKQMTNEHLNSDQIQRAATTLRQGGLVAFPTETVYGLGADAFNPAAVAEVFALKGRPAGKPLMAHVADIQMARRVVSDWPELAQELAEAFWPGPLTLVLPRDERLPGVVTGGGPTVGVRCPDHPLALALIAAFGGPVAGTSANRSGQVSPTCAGHVRESFADRAMVIDGGTCEKGIESTVVRVVGRSLEVLRTGVVGLEALERFTSDVQFAGELASASTSGGDSGPEVLRTPARLVDADQLESEYLALVQAGRAVAVLGLTVDLGRGHGRAMPGEADAYARALYAALHEVDALGVDVILIEKPTGAGPIWDAVRGRLAHAAWHDAG